MDDHTLHIEKLQAEINKAITELESSNNLEERVQLSKLINNLSSSLGTFYEIATDLLFDEPEYTDLPD